MSRESPRKRGAREAEESDDDDFINKALLPSSPLPGSAPFPPSSASELGDEDDIEEVAELEPENGASGDDLDLESGAEGEDLFGDGLHADYAADPLQDQYNLASSQIDDAEVDELDAGSRRAVDAMIDARMRSQSSRTQTASTGRFLDDLSNDLRSSDHSSDGNNRANARSNRDSQLSGLGIPLQRRRRTALDTTEEGRMSLDELADVKTESIAEWIVQRGVSATIAAEFKSFLVEYTDNEGRSVYGARITSLGEVNAESLVIDYSHLAKSRAVLASFLVSAPTEVLRILDVVAMQAVELVYPMYAQIHSEVHVRVEGLPVTLGLRELREQHTNTLVRVSGVVTRRTGVLPQLKYLKFDCRKCGQVLGPYVQDSDTEIHPSFCHACQSRGPFTLNSEKTVYRNYQRITIQERPGSVPAGRLPRQRDVVLLWDLVDVAKPGDDVDITGIYRTAYDGLLNARNGFPVFRTLLEANYVRTHGGSSDSVLSEAEEAEAKLVVRQAGDKIVDDIVASIAPSIFGHLDAKTAIAAALFGGVAQESGKTVTRGDINVLLLGDPGTAKSQLLKYAEKTARRAVFATGQGASAVGLTASVRRDAVTREWTLEGGALVLADKGICLIDEFDKMTDTDRTSIHEAMEQQTISISKAGIVASLQARCAVIAAANPFGGRYNASLTLSQNVDLTEPILSRFDVLCVVRDIVNPERDEELARFVVGSHDTAHATAVTVNDDFEGDLAAGEGIDETAPESTAPTGPISQRVLRNIIYIARSQVFPRLTNANQLARITQLYQDLRAVSLATGAVPVTVRHLESIVRLSQAFARMRLSQQVIPQDVTRAIRAAVETFVGAQKTQVQRQLRRQFAVYL